MRTALTWQVEVTEATDPDRSRVRRTLEQVDREVYEGADLQRRVSRLGVQGVDGHCRQLVVRENEFERASGNVGSEAVLEEASEARRRIDPSTLT